ncbi:hypothetical protein BHE90_011797 [Fusarium euwallaceae]|uniref:Uncharacterized protein n=1 Tax=Fusarium euwallaceae TaxID=1147111 RepID=A0A430LDF7_9HYPO|nr:hypothetical protein BHE90_011797 [Fusarium euwallaceae]
MSASGGPDLIATKSDSGLGLDAWARGCPPLSAQESPAVKLQVQEGISGQGGIPRGWQPQAQFNSNRAELLGMGIKEEEEEEVTTWKAYTGDDDSHTDGISVEHRVSRARERPLLCTLLYSKHCDEVLGQKDQPGFAMLLLSAHPSTSSHGVVLWRSPADNVLQEMGMDQFT